MACLLDGVAWRPAVRCRSDAAGRFVPVLDGVGMPLGMPADGEGSIGRGLERGKRPRRREWTGGKRATRKQDKRIAVGGGLRHRGGKADGGNEYLD